MATSVNVSIRAGRAMAFLAEIERLTADWPQSRKDDFSARWRTLQANGCELCDMLFKDGTLHVAVSDDLRRLFAEFGVRVG